MYPALHKQMGGVCVLVLHFPRAEQPRGQDLWTPRGWGVDKGAPPSIWRGVEDVDVAMVHAISINRRIIFIIKTRRELRDQLIIDTRLFWWGSREISATLNFQVKQINQ